MSQPENQNRRETDKVDALLESAERVQVLVSQQSEVIRDLTRENNMLKRLLERKNGE